MYFLNIFSIYICLPFSHDLHLVSTTILFLFLSVDIVVFHHAVRVISLTLLLLRASIEFAHQSNLLLNRFWALIVLLSDTLKFHRTSESSIPLTFKSKSINVSVRFIKKKKNFIEQNVGIVLCKFPNHQTSYNPNRYRILKIVESSTIMKSIMRYQAISRSHQQKTMVTHIVCIIHRHTCINIYQTKLNVR